MREARGGGSHGRKVSLYAIEALSKTQREFNIVRYMQQMRCFGKCSENLL